MAWLVEKVLNSQGYTTYRSPEGPDYGIDIVAAHGPLGFGHPRIVVKVKSTDTPVDRATVESTHGAMQNVRLTKGSSFLGRVEVFRRQGEGSAVLSRTVLGRTVAHRRNSEHYDNLDEDLRAELPLKRIWTVAQVEDANLDK